MPLSAVEPVILGIRASAFTEFRNLGRIRRQMSGGND